jgi:hypothetical protein
VNLSALLKTVWRITRRAWNWRKPKMSEHAPYGGSTIARTLACPGWRKLVDQLPPETSSDYADVGTLCHNAMEKIYTSPIDFDTRSVIGLEYAGHTLDEDLYDTKIEPAMKAMNDLLDRYAVGEVDFRCEVRVTLFDNAWGTADLMARGSIMLPPPNDAEASTDDIYKVGLVVDYKFGDGVVVDAFENQQGLFYGTAGAVTPETKDLFDDIDLLAIAIIQPNERGEDFTVWEVDADAMKSFAVEVSKAIDYAEKSDPTSLVDFTTGDHCRFCPARGLCPATSGEMQVAIRLDLTAPDLIERIPTFDELERVELTCKAIRQLVHEQLEAGADLPGKGYKLVPKRASRSWKDEGAATKVAKGSRKLRHAETHTAILLTPPQMEKLCKKKGLSYEELFGPHVQKISSGTTLAADDDPRAGVPGVNELNKLLDKD